MIHAREGDDELAAACLRVAVDRNAHCLLVPSDNPALQLYQSLPVRTTFFLEAQSVTLSETPHGLREAYDRLIALHPTEPDLCFGRGLCYAREERWPEAIEDFERAKSLSLDVHTPWKYQEAVLVALWKDGDVNRLTAGCPSDPCLSRHTSCRPAHPRACSDARRHDRSNRVVLTVGRRCLRPVVGGIGLLQAWATSK